MLYCIEIKCDRTLHDKRVLELVYPYWERECSTDGVCQIGMIAALDCSSVVPDYKTLYQCTAPASVPSLVLDEQGLAEVSHSGVWFPEPNCGIVISLYIFNAMRS